MSANSSSHHYGLVVEAKPTDVTNLPQRLFYRELIAGSGLEIKGWIERSRSILENLLTRISRSSLSQIGNGELQLFPMDQWNDLSKACRAYELTVNMMGPTPVSELPRLKYGYLADGDIRPPYSFIAVLDQLFHLNQRLCATKYQELGFNYSLEDYLKFQSETGWGPFARFLSESFREYWDQHLNSSDQHEFLLQLAAIYGSVDKYGKGFALTHTWLKSQYNKSIKHIQQGKPSGIYSLVMEAIHLTLGENGIFPELQPVTGHGRSAGGGANSAVPASLPFRSRFGRERSKSPRYEEGRNTRDRSLSHNARSSLGFRKEQIYNGQF